MFHFRKLPRVTILQRLLVFNLQFWFHNVPCKKSVILVFCCWQFSVAVTKSAALEQRKLSFSWWRGGSVTFRLLSMSIIVQYILRINLFQQISYQNCFPLWRRFERDLFLVPNVLLSSDTESWELLFRIFSMTSTETQRLWNHRQLSIVNKMI